jgi:hypothetical protein
MAAVRGYLVVTVAEASGRNKDEDEVWDPSFYEGFVKVEIRGGSPDTPTVKVASSKKRVLSSQISWQEDLNCEVLEGATEVRIMLCKEKRSGGNTGTSVVAACGIYVDDILEAVPIDKYFELFKPKNGGEGGFIRVAMNFSTESADDALTGDSPAPFMPNLSFKSYSKDSAEGQGDGAQQPIQPQPEEATPQKQSGGIPNVVKLLVLGAAAAGAVVVARQQRGTRDDLPPRPQPKRKGLLG